jgi:hypothetical protein
MSDLHGTVRGMHWPGTDEVPSDPYAERRCACGHVVYDDDVPGGTCRLCGCADHRQRRRAPGPAPSGRRAAGRAQDARPGIT